jgi:tetratricopeptide (TPR) repeat protein
MTDSVDALVQAVRERRLIIFCGAGVSMLAPSCSPSWWEIYAAAAQCLGDRLREGFPQLGASVDMAALLEPLANQHLADLVASRFAGPTFSSLLAVVDVADANENHRAIAALASCGGLRAVVTTNFDTLIERAAAVRGVRMAVAAPGVAAQPGPGDACVLIKLHGTTVDAQRMIETSEHKAREASPTLRQAWVDTLDGADVLVLGYSGADLNFGAAHSFFEDVLGAGARIWWFHRPGREPTLPDRVGQRVTLVAADLPDPLRPMLIALGEPDFPMPLSGRDAHAALARAMDAWSRQPHIGRWSAATFFLALCERSGDAARPLRDALMLVAREQVARFPPGATFNLDDIAAAGFFSAAGAEELSRLEVNGAVALLETALNIFGSVGAAFGPGSLSYDERQCNLANVWNNLAHARLLGGGLAPASAAFQKALQHALLGGDPGGFLIALTNILHYGFELNDVRRCMRLAESALQLADRIGATQSSIELRLLLGCYACDRNELWSADEWLREAHRRAVAVGDEVHKAMAEIQLGECALRSGQLADGLALIAAAVAGHGDAAFLFRPTEEVRRHLVVLGIEQPKPYSITLAADQIPAFVTRINDARQAARAAGALPWRGAHCSVSSSASVGDDDRLMLFQLGVLEFDGDADAAIELGLHLAESMLDQGQHFDAGWAARNALLRPGLPVAARARARGALAEVAAALGRIGEASRDFEAAAEDHAHAGKAMPAAMAAAGMWFFIQCDDGATALRWAGHAVAGMAGQAMPPQAVRAELARIDSWGEPMAAVAATLRAGLAASGPLPPLEAAPAAAEPYRMFRGATAMPVPSDPAVAHVLAAAEGALQTGQSEQARDLVDGLAGRGVLPEQQGAAALVLQLLACAPGSSVEQLEAFADAQHARLLATLSFGALAQLETAMLWALLKYHGATTRAATRLARHGWLADMAEDPVARARLQAWDALRSSLSGQPVMHTARCRNALRAAHYFGLPERELGDALAGKPVAALAKPAATPDPVSKALRDLAAGYAASTDAAAADAVLAEAVRNARRTRHLSRDLLARMRGGRAGWALKLQRFDEAQSLYRRTQRSFRVLGRIDDALTAMAGEARACSRAGQYDAAVKLFQQALGEAGAGAMRFNLMLGLGAAHLLQGAERANPADLALLGLAVGVFRQAVEVTSIDSRERSLARLAWARALGEQGAQLSALDMFDQAVAEMAHHGDPRAKLLLENRDLLVDGQWRVLSLF